MLLKAIDKEGGHWKKSKCFLMALTATNLRIMLTTKKLFLASLIQYINTIEKSSTCSISSLLGWGSTPIDDDHYSSFEFG